VKRTGRGKSIGAVIHICMETTQEISLCSYLYLNLEKASCFSFYLLYFFFYIIREYKSGAGSAWVGTGTGGRGEVAGKEVGG
jgi:hypothetical protein